MVKAWLALAAGCRRTGCFGGGVPRGLSFGGPPTLAAGGAPALAAWFGCGLSQSIHPKRAVIPFCRQKGTEKAPLFRSGMGSAARFTAPPYAPLQRLRRTISVAKMLDNTQSIICAFCLAAGTPRTPYQCVESCGAALIYPASLPLRFRQDKFSKRPHCDAADPRREEVPSAEILQQKQNFLTPMGL